MPKQFAQIALQKCILPGQSLETARELEATLGKYQYEDDKGHKVVRPLLTNDEIRTIKTNQALLICGNFSPILARLKPFYKRRDYLQFSQIPFQHQEREVYQHKIPALELTSSPILTNE